MCTSVAAPNLLPRWRRGSAWRGVATNFPTRAHARALAARIVALSLLLRTLWTPLCMLSSPYTRVLVCGCPHARLSRCEHDAASLVYDSPPRCAPLLQGHHGVRSACLDDCFMATCIRSKLPVCGRLRHVCIDEARAGHRVRVGGTRWLHASRTLVG